MAGRPGIERLMTPAEVAARFRVCGSTVTCWADEGKLAVVRTPGGHRRYKAAEVLALLAPPDPLAAPAESLWPAAGRNRALAVRRRLDAAGIRTVGELTALDARELKALGFRPAQVDVVRLALYGAGLALRGEVLDKVA